MPDADADRKEARRAQARYALAFVGIAGLLLTLYSFPYAELGVSEAWFEGYLAGYAHLVGAVLGVVEPGLRVDGTLITGRYALRIVKTCDAMEVNLLFAAAVLATPGAWLKKLGALALGLAALIAANVLRICSLYYAGALAPRAFNALHEEIWPLVLIAAACAAFFYAQAWLRRGALLEPSAPSG